MIRFNRQIFILPLVACLLVVPALASPAMVTHETQHAHHKAATHFSTLCSWFCGVGQGFNLADAVFVPSIDFLSTLDIESAGQDDVAVSVLSLSLAVHPQLLSSIEWITRHAARARATSLMGNASKHVRVRSTKQCT